MKKMLFISLALSCATVSAQIYECPRVHPYKTRSDAPLAGARIMWGAKYGNGWIAGADSKRVKGGIDTQYDFGDHGWLVCLYDLRKRSERNRPEDAEWWIQLDPKLSRCNLQSRETTQGTDGMKMASATAICK